MELIPNLPNDIARECFIRASYAQFSTIASTSKGWNMEIHSPDFFRHRRAASHRQKLLLLSQSRVDPVGKSGFLKRCSAKSVYRLTLLEAETGRWVELPPLPWFPDGLPLFCQLAAVGSDLVVIGGFDAETWHWEVSNSVFVFSFLSATWRRGADMPGVRRMFFGCASDYDRRVFVAGGHDGEKNALKSALVYDVAKDEWTHLPDMARQRDECKVVFQRGKFHVIGGYHTEMQGRFEKSAEAFEVATWQWDQVQEDFLEVATCPRTCTVGTDMDLFRCHGNDVVARRGSTWKAVAKLPDDVCNVAYVTTWQEGLLLIGSRGFGEPHMAYVLDLKKYEWTKLESSEKYSGHVQSGCYLEI